MEVPQTKIRCMNEGYTELALVGLTVGFVHKVMLRVERVCFRDDPQQKPPERRAVTEAEDPEACLSAWERWLVCKAKEERLRIEKKAEEVGSRIFLVSSSVWQLLLALESERDLLCFSNI